MEPRLLEHLSQILVDLRELPHDIHLAHSRRDTEAVAGYLIILLPTACIHAHLTDTEAAAFVQLTGITMQREDAP